MIKKLFIRFLINVQRKARRKSLKRAIARAKEITLETNKKVLIYFIGGEYVAITKQSLRSKWKQKELPPHMTLQEAEQAAEVKIESYDKRKKVDAAGN